MPTQVSRRALIFLQCQARLIAESALPAIESDSEERLASNVLWYWQILGNNSQENVTYSLVRR